MGGRRGEAVGLRCSGIRTGGYSSMCLDDYKFKAIPHDSVVFTIHHSPFITLQY